MPKFLKTLGTLLLCLSLLAGIFLLWQPLPVSAKNHGLYKDIAKILDQGDCPAMQGMSVHGNYVYACKINATTETSAVVAKVHKETGSTVYLTNAATGTIYFSDFGHGNDIEVETISGVTTLFVPTSKKGSGSLVRYAINGSTATKLGTYTMTYNGANISGGAIRVMHLDDEYITFLFKSGMSFYTGKMGISQTGGTVEMKYLFKIDYTTAYVNDVPKYIGDYSGQGFGYHDNKIYVPLTGHNTADEANVSIILVYDLQGASGTLKPEKDPTFCITSSAYSALYEVESCEIDPHTGRLYFNTNRRVTSSDTNHDSVAYITNWTYKPAERNTEPGDYRWEVVNGKLASVTDGGSVYNGLTMHQGTVSDSTVSNGRFSMDKTVVLKHDSPWVLEWKAKNFTAGTLMFATETTSSYPDSPYIFCRTNNVMISIGYNDGTQYNNYGIELTGVDASAEHVYRLTNKLASDGSNMVYLSVDGTELGALNRYYVASTYQGTTSNWISGKDFAFSYIGTSSHALGIKDLKYIQVWGNGIPEQRIDQYYWLDQGSGLTAVGGDGLTENPLTTVEGSYYGGIYSSARMELSQAVVLRHDRPWSLEWQSNGPWTGGSILLGADDRSNTYAAPYLYRSGSVIALGAYDGSGHQNSGIKLADHGISNAVPHVYCLTNKIADDGTNMIYLSVDGKELGAMNNSFVGSTAQGTTTDWLCGRDFTFSYLGSYQHPINAVSIRYIRISEACTTHSYGPWSTTPATCTQDGSRSRSCLSCGKTETEVLAAAGHAYTTAIRQGSCKTYATYTFTCTACGDTFTKNALELTTQWLGFCPEGVDADLLRTKTEYRYSDYNTLTSYEPAMAGYTCEGMELVKAGTSTVSYVSSWPEGFDTAHSLYSQYNKQKAAVSDTETTRTAVDSDGVTGYLYYHWCYSGNTASSAVQQGSYTRFHAFYSTTAPENYVCDTSDYSYKVTDNTACGDSLWFCCVPVYTQQTTVYNKLYTYSGWSAYSQWSAEAVTATAERRVETRTVYQLTEAKLEDHHYSGGYCIGCGEADPNSNFYLFGYINGENYACEEDYLNQGIYRFEDGKLTVSFSQNSYVAVKLADNEAWYMTNGWLGEATTSATLYNTATLGANADKLFVPANMEIVFTLVRNSDDTLTLSYTATPILTPSIKAKRPSLSFEGEIYYNIYYEIKDFTAKPEDMGLLTWAKPMEDGTIADAGQIIPGAAEATGGEYVVRSGGIPAKNLGDALYFKVYAKLADGSYVYSKMYNYSGKAYAMDRLANSTNEKMKALCVAMLNYGAAAQLQFNYKPYALMNAELTAEQKALVEPYAASMINRVSAADADKIGEFANTKGYTKRYPAVSFEGAFSITYYMIPKNTPAKGVTMYYWTQETYNSVGVLTRANADGVFTMEEASAGTFKGIVEGIAAKEIDKPVYVAGIYENGGVSYATGVLVYSLGEYCVDRIANGSDTMKTLAQATAVYGYYAKQYFAN